MHQPAQHVDRVREPAMRSDRDARRLEGGRLPAVRVRIGQRDSRRRLRAVGECLLADRGECIELWQLVARNDGRGRAGIGACVCQEVAVSGGGCAERQLRLSERGRTYVIQVTTPESRAQTAPTSGAPASAAESAPGRAMSWSGNEMRWRGRGGWLLVLG